MIVLEQCRSLPQACLFAHGLANIRYRSVGKDAIPTLEFFEVAARNPKAARLPDTRGGKHPYPDLQLSIAMI